MIGPLVASGALVVAGLWLALAHGTLPVAAPFGWLLVVLGVVFLGANLLLRRRGHDPRRDRSSRRRR